MIQPMTTGSGLCRAITVVSRVWLTCVCVGVLLCAFARSALADVLLLHQGFYKGGLSWSVNSDGTAARFALRAQTSGYVSFAFVHPDWPLNPVEYE
jgi:hypothetical protein